MVPLPWLLAVGTTWQFEQAIAFDSAGAVLPWFTWARCTPATPVAEATMGGEDLTFPSAVATPTRAASPWQEAQDCGAVSVMVPSMWVARAPAEIVPVVAVR